MRREKVLPYAWETLPVIPECDEAGQVDVGHAGFAYPGVDIHEPRPIHVNLCDRLHAWLLMRD